MPSLRLVIGLCTFMHTSVLAMDKTNCVSKELRLQNCILRFKKAELSFSKSAVRIFDGTWREVMDLPSVDKVTQWKSIKVRKLADRTLVEMKVWQKEESAPSLELEGLHWKIFTVNGTKLNLQQDKVIQRRRRKSVEGDTVSAEFLLGRLESHMIMLEGEEIMWKVGHKKGKLIAEK